MSKTVAAGKFKQTCLKLLDEVGQSGEPILITKRGKPVAELTPVSGDSLKDWKGAMRGQGEILGDLVVPASDPGEWEVLNE